MKKTPMRETLIKKLRCLLLFVLPFMLTLLSGCGFHLQYETEIPKQFQTMTFYSYDPYGTLSREIKQVLNDNHVKLINGNSLRDGFASNDAKNSNLANRYPSLKIINSELTRGTISIYQDGKSAEYQLILILEAQVIIAGDDIYPIAVKVSRTFVDNPATALAKSTEQNLIEREMHHQVAKQLIGKLKSINAIDKKILAD